MEADYSWSWEPGLLVALAGALAIYTWRWRAVRRESGRMAVSGWRLAAWVGGLAAVFAAVISPLDRLGEQLMVVHMAQHLLLLDLAPILLLAGLTRVLLRPATRRLLAVERAVGPLAHPVLAALAYSATMALWHVPALYDAALRETAVHVLEHSTLIGAGLLYWWHLMAPIRGRHPMTGLQPLAYMFSTKLVVGIVGIVLTFTGSVLYAYADRARVWELSALDDQNMGGALMALEQSIVMGIALVAIFVRALGESDRSDQRAERYGKVSPAP